MKVKFSACMMGLSSPKRVCLEKTSKQHGFTSFSSTKPTQKKGWERKACSIIQDAPLSCGSSVPLLSLKSLFVVKHSIMQTDRQRAKLQFHGATCCHHSTFNPVALPKYLLLFYDLSLQWTLDEGQFVWMFKAAALAGGALYEMDRWFAVTGGGLEYICETCVCVCSRSAVHPVPQLKGRLVTCLLFFHTSNIRRVFEDE